MSKPKCILCGKDLYNGAPVNREHYVPHVLIRNFSKLKMNPEYSHALRIDLREDEGELMLAPKSAHKEWATVKTHAQCNSDASPMCRDFKWIIDHIDHVPEDKTNRILDYYAHIWGMNQADLIFRIIPDDELEAYYRTGEFGITYAPGYLWVGKIVIGIMDTNQLFMKNDYEKHTIFMGPKPILEKVINDYADGEEPDYANPYGWYHRRMRATLGFRDAD